MTYRDFCYWLKGHLTNAEENFPTIITELDKTIHEEELKTQTFVALNSKIDLKGESWPISSPQDFYNK